MLICIEFLRDETVEKYVIFGIQVLRVGVFFSKFIFFKATTCSKYSIYVIHDLIVAAAAYAWPSVTITLLQLIPRSQTATCQQIQVSFIHVKVFLVDEIRTYKRLIYCHELLPTKLLVSNTARDHSMQSLLPQRLRS